ncbi:MAG: oligosaccharide flippase family protein, partial [Nitrososphaerales archaeon]
MDGPVPDDMASPASQTLRQRLLGREGFGYLVAMTFVNVSNFAFHILVSRQLGPSSYGAVSALLNIVTFVSIPLLAFQAAVVVDVAKRGKHGALSMRPLFNMTLLVGLGVTAMLMLTSPAIADFLSLGSVLPVVVLSTWFVTTIPTPALAGASMGQFRFKPVAVASVAGAIVRLVLTGLLGWWGVSLEAPLIGTAVGSAVTMLVLVVALRPNLRRFVRHPLRLSRSTLGWTLTVL